MTTRLLAERTADGRVHVTSPPGASGRRTVSIMLSPADAHRLAAQLLAATVEDEKFQEGAALGAQAFDFATRLRKLTGI